MGDTDLGLMLIKPNDLITEKRLLLNTVRLSLSLTGERKLVRFQMFSDDKLKIIIIIIIENCSSFVTF